MWEMVSNMIPAANRMMSGRRNRGMNTATAMLLGAGIGIATWEVMRRNNAVGNIMDGNMGKMANNAIGNMGKMANNATENMGQMADNAKENMGQMTGIDNGTMAEMAKEVMDAIK